MASQDLSTTGLEGCLPVSGTKAIYDWFFFALLLFFDSLNHGLADPPYSVGNELKTT